MNLSKTSQEILYLKTGVLRAYPRAHVSKAMAFINAYHDFLLRHPNYVHSDNGAIPATEEFKDATRALFDTQPNDTEEQALKRLASCISFIDHIWRITQSKRINRGPPEHS